MSNATASVAGENHIPLVFQYTVEAYKMFQKLAELLPNPMSAAMYKNLAEDERELRDLLEVKYTDPETPRMKITLGADLRFQDALEGDLSPKALTEFLISREKTMANKLAEMAKGGSPNDRNILNYVAAAKRAHIVYLQRELEMIGIYNDWYKREDAESLIVHGRDVENA